MKNREIWYENLSKGQQYWVRNITPEILTDSIIIDFEGPIEGQPELAGVYYDNKFTTHFLSPVYESCIDRYENSDVTTFEDFCIWIDFMIEEGYKILAFSTHEGEVLLPHMSNQNISFWYRDAHKYFKRHPRIWIGIKRPSPFTLSSVLERLGIKERQYGERRASQYLKYARSQLEEGRSFENLTKAAKKKLTSVVHYNEDDVCCLREAILASFKI